MASEGAIALPDYSSGFSSAYEPSEIESVRSRHTQRAEEQELISLPRADGGTQAWLFLVACFFVEALIWGFPFSFGLFQEYYETHEPFSEEPSGITAIGTTALGIMYLTAPLVSLVLQAFPRHRRLVSFVGFIILVVGLVSSSFATRVWHLILTQGVLYAIGGCLLYFPTIIYLDEWFVQRKGMAFGVMWSGTGVSGVCVPFIMNWGLNKYGFSTMLRAWAVTLVLLSGPLLYFLKPRVPVSRTAALPRNLNFGFLKTSTFWFLQIGNILEGLGFFIPNIYLPSYASSLGLSRVQGTITVFLFNLTSVFGTIIMGSLTDRFDVTSIILVSTLGAAFSVFLFWGFATSLPMLCIFSLSYGLTAGGFSSTWTGMTREVKKLDDRFETNLIFGQWAAGRGIGSVVSGPLSEALVRGKPWTGEAALGYGSGYGALIAFTGVSAVLGTTGWVGRRTGWI